MSSVEFVMVQDSEAVIKPLESLWSYINSLDDLEMDIDFFQYGIDLEKHLENFTEYDDIPSHFYLDHNGAGVPLAKKIIEWFKKNRPEKGLPEIHFVSLDAHTAAGDAAQLKIEHPEVNTGYFSHLEIDQVINAEILEIGRQYRRGRPEFPETTSFREYLNTHLGTQFDLCVDEEMQAELKETFDNYEGDQMFHKFRSGEITSQELITSARQRFETPSKSIFSGLAALQGDDIKTDSSFFDSAGQPIEGDVVFSLSDVEAWDETSDKKPILVMNSYDARVVPHIRSGKLGGIVTLGQYMADHLALICNANNVAGLFALKKEGDETLGKEFGEMVGAYTEPYFTPKLDENGDAYIDFNGHKLTKGDEVIAGVGDRGLVYTEENKGAVLEKIAQLGFTEQPEMDLSATEQDFLDDLNYAFSNYFSEQGLVDGLGYPRNPKVKVNVDSVDNPAIKLADGIGLVRTEQLTASDETASELLREVLLTYGENDNQESLLIELGEKHKMDLRELAKSTHGTIKVRLYDIPTRELLTPEQQERFYEKYGVHELQGGPALDAWEDLYRMQVHSILKVIDEYDSELSHVQIMMPSVKTEEETLRIKEIIRQEAAKLELDGYRYDFGVMIETNEAVENAESILPHCDFVSFGTNDLTEDTFGIPRSEAKLRERFRNERGFDPFKKLAPEVMKKIKYVCDIAQKIKQDNIGFQTDICGAQATDLETAFELFKMGVDNFSVAPTSANVVAFPILLRYQMYDRFAELKPQPVLDITEHNEASMRAKPNIGFPKNH